MKKILLMMIAFIIIMPVTSSQKAEPIKFNEIKLLKKIYSPTNVNDFFDGNFSGWFGTKNEDGSFDFLGDVQ